MSLFFYLVLFGADRLDGTHVGTCTTISTKLRINHIDVSFGDCLNGAFVNASTTCGTFIRNYVSHIFRYY